MWSDTLKNPQSRHDYVTFLTERDKTIGSFLHISDSTQFDSEESTLAGPLAGVPIGVKDNIAVQGMPLTCGSRILENLVSPYTATAVTNLINAGAVVAGKTNLDEFGMGSTTENSAYQQTNNPWNVEYVAGGSSGGSAAAVAARMVPFAIGSDTGGSIRQPAAFCGVYGLKPTYGTVSRYGLVAYASSLEVIGAVAESVDILEHGYTAMKATDPLDQSSVADPGTVDPKARTIGVLAGDLGLDPAVERNYRAFVSALRDLGYETREISLKTLEYVVPAYYTIAAAEASANLARFNGVRYGYRPDYAENPEELMRKARTEAFGAEVKLRIVLGTYVLRSGFQDQYYVRAQKIRTLIRRELDDVFAGGVDLICSPVFPTQAFPHGSAGMDAFQQKVADRFTTTANLAGIPAITVPSGRENGLPVGMQCMAPAFGEKRLFAVARSLAETFPISFPERMTPFRSEP